MESTTKNLIRLARATDNELHRRLLTDDGPAGTELYKRHRRAVYVTAKSVIKDPDLAEDVTQEVFLEFLRRPAAADPSRGTIAAFLRLMARRRAIDAVRSIDCARRREATVAAGRPDAIGCGSGLGTTRIRRTSRRGAVLEPDGHNSHDGQDPGHMAAVRAEQASLQQALRRLPEKQRTAIGLAYYGDRTYREVASMLGIPEGTAKSRMRAALAHLAQDTELSSAA